MAAAVRGARVPLLGLHSNAAVKARMARGQSCPRLESWRDRCNSRGGCGEALDGARAVVRRDQHTHIRPRRSWIFVSELRRRIGTT